ncbi:MAG: metal-dependent hydrolase [Planctomycetota bacterium]|jgi:L-ascorbate metabolism protein UlaG (beta-lactamase superfamily)|nr:metal-dependent hydrolase [Planctomycetota bacterium]MEC7429431.1 metal-dependent hydrolase [Planctomycetota bacterium]MEC7450711.1 metal-dependent hydrolase [Planctomycetota bacterium]MEC7717340.1 metal-dependent hydrolase [Planctomycetota bacterium]MEC8160893.1 metal-dependent hydrolase [Planctomycetota bacterium]
MSIELTWFGHGTWQISLPEHTILLDPFFDDNPSSPIKAAEVDADFILISHGHFDHIADAAAVANRTNATVVAIYEVAQWLAQNGEVKETIGMNIGGGVQLPFGHVKMTPALHSSQLPDGSYGGEPAGFVLTLNGKRIYFACDTGLFSDMKLIGTRGIDLAVLPIGDLFTMGPDDSIEAIKLLRPKRVAPAHFNTWPPIEQDSDAWALRVKQETDSDPVVLNPGGQFTL